MTDATGVLDEAFGITSETAEFKFNKAMETSKGVLLDIGTTLLEMVNPHLDKFIAFIQENGPAIEESFIKIYETVNRIITSEALAGVAGIVEEMWPDVESLVLQLLDLAETLTPIVSDSLAQILPMLGDMAAILDGIAYFTDEVINSFGDWDLETDGIVEFITRQINPMQRLADTLRMLRETIDNAREAWERFKGAGGLNQLEGVVSTGTLGGRRAAGGPVSGGSSYLVGERGPEIFTPMSSGNIIPNDRLGGSTNINITVNAGMGANGKQLGEQIVTAIKRYERTSGPVFASA